MIRFSLDVENNVAYEEATASCRKLSLEKICPNCLTSRGIKIKMAVKFNFDHINSSNGDTWIEFTCNVCKK